MNGGSNVFVLYRVANCDSDPSSSPCYNAFEVPRNRTGGITLADIKRRCIALHSLNHAGPDGYHWRVRMDDNQSQQQKSARSAPPSFSWWDIQDDNAKLPIKESVPLSELDSLYAATGHRAGAASPGGSPTSHGHGGASPSSHPGKSAVAGAVRSLGKAINTVATTVDTSMSAPPDPNEPRVSVIAFKLLDLVKVNDGYQQGRRGGGAVSASSDRPAAGPTQRRRRAQKPPQNAAPLPTQQQRQRVRQPPARQQQKPQQPQTQQPQRRQRQSAAAANRGGAGPAGAASRATRAQAPPAAAPRAQAAGRGQTPGGGAGGDAPLMDFGNSPPRAGRKKVALHHATSLPTGFMGGGGGGGTTETRAETLKRQYEEGKRRQNRVWDEVDQRWVVVEAGAAGVASSRGSVSAPPGAVSSSAANPPSAGKKKIVGISLDASNAVGKSATVQNAVHRRVSEMKDSQERAKAELREREAQKKKGEDEEDVVRRRLEPKVKAWSEEHGKKKQLAALLASLHVILWEEAGWKQVNLGDLLDDKKLRRSYKRATLKVHPDKTQDLDAEKRFLAKRIFDALSQAMTQYEDGKRN